MNAPAVMRTVDERRLDAGTTQLVQPDLSRAVAVVVVQRQTRTPAVHRTSITTQTASRHEAVNQSLVGPRTGIY